MIMGIGLILGWFSWIQSQMKALWPQMCTGLVIFEVCMTDYQVGKPGEVGPFRQKRKW